MESMKFSFSLGVGLLLAACSKPPQFETSRWSQRDLTPAPQFEPAEKTKPLSIGSRKIVFQSQFIEGAEVEGSFYKEIESKALEFKAYKWIQNPSAQLRNQVHMMKTLEPKLKNLFFKSHPTYEPKDLVGEPELVVRGGEPFWKLVFQVRGLYLQGLYVNSHLKIKEKAIMGSHVAPSALLFPDGPLKSSLQKVFLEDLGGRRILSSDKIKVITQSPTEAIAENDQFLYPVEDYRFEQVQVFFYLSKMLQWTSQRFQFQLPFVLEAETSFGYPEKTNAAFYYQRKIRLGEGDGVVFSEMALDPSIVIHESFHSVIEAVAKLPYEGEGGSLNEAYSDLFTALLLEQPRLGEASYKKAPYKRTVENNLSLSEKNGGLYHDSGIVSGLLWALVKSLGDEKGPQLAWEVLLKLNPQSDFEDFKKSLHEALLTLPEKDQQKTKLILQQRGWSS